MSTNFVLNASAFVLAAAATVGTFGANALLARHQYVTAEHIALAGASAPQKVIVIGRRWPNA